MAHPARGCCPSRRLRVAEHRPREQHHVGMPTDGAARKNGLTRLFSRMPSRLRVALLLAWFGLAVFAKWAGLNNHEVPTWVWVVLVPGLIVMSVMELASVSRSLRSPHRRKFDPVDPAWTAFLVITGSLLVLGPLSFFDDDPKTDPVVGGIMFGVGVVFVVLFVLHLLKPIREDAEDPSR